ncbi:DUF3619 family protein [Limnohabitans radicicola]|uniref:DUF3619 family protein n=1 Tax=Limnohabitans radicicola TaxID=2771427 RepID=A0A927FCY7_9BURK|nr:DUF3619 family protein [Limnohabitans radicicola]MBD8049019.1 DUF3619 family protein [Limnohabitans radicicola]
MKTQDLTAQHDPMDLLGQQLAQALTRHSSDLPHDVSERLRFARQQAMAVRKPDMAPALLGIRQSNGSLTLAGPPSEGLNLWNILGSALPLIALVAGLVTVSWINRENTVAELAAVDSALLVDELPPAAYTDPGFAQFLKQGLGEAKSND